MTATHDAVLSAIGDGAKNTSAICESTGFEQNTVHQATHQLRKSGAIVKGADGFELGSGVPPKARVHTIATPGEDKAERRKPTKKIKRTKKSNVSTAAKPAKATAPKTNGTMPTLECAAFGEFLVVKRKDVLSLLALVDTWRQAMFGDA